MPAGPLHTLWHALNWIICRKQIQKKADKYKNKADKYKKIKQTNTKKLQKKQTNTELSGDMVVA